MRLFRITMFLFVLLLMFAACSGNDVSKPQSSAEVTNPITQTPESQPIVTITDDVEAKTDDANAKTDDVEAKKDDAEAKTDVAEAKTDVAEAKTGDVIAKTDVVDEKEDLTVAIDKSIKEFKYLPPSYTLTDTNKGTIEKLDYKTNTYDSKNQELDKYLNVYLPYGYDPADSETKYNVFYLMHGGGENQNTIFGGPGKNAELMKILDNMIKNADIEPLIVVTPTFYNPGNGNASQLTRDFHNELVNDIIPAVEGKYNTYAASTSEEDLKASRSHRAFGGFSMGGACTWYTYINCLDYFEYIMPLSGDCWALGDGAGRSKSVETAKLLAKVAEESGYGTDEYYIFCATGTNDVAHDNMVPQIEAMKKLTDRFIYTADFTEGNFYFMVAKGGTHSWNYINQYIYNILPYFFIKK